MNNSLKSEFKLIAKLVFVFLIIIIPTLFTVVLLNFFLEHFTTGIYGCLVAQKDYAVIAILIPVVLKDAWNWRKGRGACCRSRIF